ncbi:MAG: hypothetical protein JSR45_13985 [Proteobacteria bacterium]|nr:hypothetical protein [Pseudomonadota bacterium]
MVPFRMARSFVALVTRHTYEEFDGRKVLLHFTFQHYARGRSTVGVIQKEHMPEFEGYRAWFVVERVYARPDAYWRGVEQVHDRPLPAVSRVTFTCG